MALLTDVIEGLASLPQPAVVGATGALVLAECTIGLGFIAPGESGLLIASATVDSVPRFMILWLVVTVCAGVGDSIGYAVGRRFGPRLRETKIVRKIGQQHWDRASDLLRRRGAWAVFFARFLPVVRTLTPASAGTAGLPYRKFLPAVVLGAAGWSATHIGIGAAAGASAKAIEDSMGTAGAVLLVSIIVVVVAVKAIRNRRAAARERAVAAVETEPLAQPAVHTEPGQAAGTVEVAEPGTADRPRTVPAEADRTPAGPD